MVLKLRSIAPAIVPVAMNGAFGANATVAHRFTCFTYGCWYAIVASPRTAPPPFDEMIEGRGLSKRRAGEAPVVPCHYRFRQSPREKKKAAEGEVEAFVRSTLEGHFYRAPVRRRARGKYTWRAERSR